MASITDGAGPAPAATTEWRDRKRYLWLIGLVMPALAFVAVGGHAWTGWSGWLWIGPVVVLGIVPVVDLLVGVDRSNPPDEVIAALEADRYYRWITFLFLPLQYAGLVAAFWVIANGDLSTADKVGLAVTMGFLSGIGINTAHELGHKREPVERWMAKIALAPSCYGHFYIEHNRGHHVRVATPEDPASSRMGESFYAFWPRTVFGSLRSAWRLEKRRYARRQQGPFRLDNDVLNAWLLSRRAVGRPGRLARRRDPAVPRAPGGAGLHAARARQLPRALRHAPPAGRGSRQGALRAGGAHPQLERQQHRHQRAALPPAAAQRPPRQPHAPLPGAARLRGRAAAADRLRRDDPHRAGARRGGAGSWTRASWPTTDGTSRGPTCPPASARALLARYPAPPGVAAAPGCRARRPTVPCPPAAPARTAGPRGALPRLRLCLRRVASATSARASPPERPGRRSRTPGAAPTAGSATRSTSSPCRATLGVRVSESRW